MNSRIRSLFVCFLIGASTAGLCLWQLHGSYGFNLSDEGFFWYGAKQTARGEVPGLDFLAYEPGRYYWAAAIFKAFGSSSNHMARVASVLFGAIMYGSITSLLIERRKDIGKAKTLVSITFLAATLSTWSFPYYRITDVVAPCLSFLLCYQQYEDRRPKSSLITGFWAGMIMCFGRNHALYTLLGLLIVILYMQAQERDIGRTMRRIWLGAVGMVAGITPFLILALLRPGYPNTITSQWFSMLKTGKTNLPLPWPLPWKTISNGMPLSEADGHLIIGILFMSLFAVAIAGTAAVAIAAANGRHVPPELAAMTATTAGYLHYGMDRADMEHIGPALMPVILGFFLWSLRGKIAMTAACTLTILIPTARVAARQQSAYHCIRQTIPCTFIDIDRETRVATSTQTAQLTKSALKEIRGTRFLAAPAYPALYAMTETKSPIWDIYAAWPRSEEEQHRAIHSIQANEVSTIILNRNGFGGDARFEHTNPLLFSFITKRYKLCRNLGGEDILVLRQNRKFGCSTHGARK